jgi:hypothetical protein
MAWGKVDDNLAFHPKVLAVGNEAMGVWVRALSWSMQQLTDGFIPNDILVALKAMPVSSQLVEVGLWHEAEGGFQFNDWNCYQPTREQVLSERAKVTERQAKWREAKAKNNGVTNAVTNGVTNAAPTRPDPTHIREGRATRLPQDFKITNEMKSWSETKNISVDLAIETEKFMNYYSAVSGKAGTKLDWVATWRNWILKANEWSRPKDEIDPWAGKRVFG